MAETTIASAIAVPEPDPESTSSTNVLKRRQSEASEPGQDNKRQRTSPGKNSPTAAKDGAKNGTATENGGAVAIKEEPTDTREVRRKSSIADEKQRSKRLFGALLGNLNQPSDRTSKRRQEIESRRKAELQRQDDERVEDKQRRQEKLAKQRRREQSTVDEQHMRIRHSNMLHAANFLQTVSEPKLYYKPWDLRSDEEDRIDDQIKDTQSRIDKELDEFDQLRAQQAKADDEGGAAELDRNNSVKPDTDQPSIDQQDGAGDKADTEDEAPAKSANITEESKPSEVPESPDTNNHTNNQEYDEVKKNEEEMEEEVDHAVDGDEDTVIY